MNVSSVKNLNGETFSAVQDATLTDVVQSNSAQWGQGGATGDYVPLSATEVKIGLYNTATNDNNFTQGKFNLADLRSFSQGYGSTAKNNSLTQGFGNSATNQSFAQGSANKALQSSLAQGEGNSALNYSFAQGLKNSAYWDSFAQGEKNSAHNYSFSLGLENSARLESIAVGVYNKAGVQSMAVGYGCEASNRSQALGSCVSATNSGMAIGTYNDVTTGAFVIGNGNSATRSDCFIIDHEGNVSAAGKISANGVELGAGGGSIPVSNSGDFYKVEFDGVDLYGNKSTSSTPNFVYSAVSSQESTYIQYTPYPQWNNQAILDFRNWSSVDIISVSSNGNGILPVHYPYGITALNVYYQAEYVFDYNNNQLPNFSGYVGQITLDNLFISSYFDKPSYFNDIERVSQFRLWFSGNEYEGQINNHYICSVGNKVQSGTNTIEGIIVPSTAGLASESYVQANSAVLTGMIGGKQDTLTFGYDEQDRINSINSSALAGGGDVPEDVMVETNLEYNAVGEISGYGNSAIAQYGAEKQWLQHDDTLVHASNSAQYALGVNVSALQRLMGIDETVLWENKSGYTEPPITLSESLSSFKTIKFVGRNEGSTSNYIPYKVWEFDTDSLKISNYITLDQIMPNNPGNNWNVGIYCRVSNLDASVDKTLTIAKTDSYTITSAGTWTRQSTDSWGNVRLHKVIGIGRKA